MVEYFPVSQVTGNADQAIAGSQRFLQHLHAFDLADVSQRLFRRPDPGAGTFGEGPANIHQALSDQLFQFGFRQLGEALGQVDPHYLAGSIRQFPHQPAYAGPDALHGTPGQ